MKRNKKNNSLIKGVYGHPQVSGYFVVKQYMVLEQDGKRCLLLRFVNELTTTIQTVEFTVKQFNAAGKSIGKLKIKYTGLSVKGGELYVPEQGIVIQDECVDFAIQMKYIISENVKYLYKKGIVTSHYNPRGFEEKQAKVSASKNKVGTKRRYWGGGKIYVGIAWISFVLMLLMFWFLSEQTKDAYQRQEATQGKSSVVTQQNDQ